MYVVPSADEEYPDLSAAGEGGIVLSGAVTDTLRYAAPYVFFGGGGANHRIRFADSPIGTGSTLENEILYDYHRGARVTLTSRSPLGETRSFVWYPGRYAAEFEATPDRGRIEVGEQVLDNPDGQTVTASGTLTLATRRVIAGDTLLFFSWPQQLQEELSTYTVDSDSAVVRSVSCSYSTETVDLTGVINGTERSGVFQFDSAPSPCQSARDLPTRVTYRLDGDALVVKARDDNAGYTTGFGLVHFPSVYGVADPTDRITLIRNTLERTH